MAADSRGTCEVAIPCNPYREPMSASLQAGADLSALSCQVKGRGLSFH